MSTDLWREPMDPHRVAASVARPGRWDIRYVTETGSTNDDLARGAAGPAPAGAITVLITEEQRAGRGRSGRQWACPPGAGLMFSVRLDLAGIPVGRRGWTGAVLGLAIVGAFAEVAGVEAGLKWPNDVLIGGHKAGGILAEMAGDAVIVGAGLNISLQPEELPRPDATSLLLAGAAPVDRDRLLAAVLDRFAVLLDEWTSAGGDVDAAGIRRRYLDSCVTIGQTVRLDLPDGAAVVGTVVDVDPDGAVVLSVDGRPGRYSAGDVVHLRQNPTTPVG
ncbi:BirA family transcriptional regulator, biotin operon repressor / biotin-[acetyl-CoA-carboxylase] ligase [Nakamurella panacisegetis]|uniref:biotin--[biotin carboxyl-carrier protein] ligase n=1 Tax=Nakamurella panacisegetis TaxID=1090615 RepID=A0A1H0PFW1_9ACTN|nr:biotin--[acetyl-CoA-carboxylase] ligase [Nakamurella panacisegetis]SDP03569.1 BirA family transcriptional regulator, biotin operon repressor / biotin-[acetyl-CoA-carboxylase] ligase [Nakamurella panacisegetis]